MNSILAVQLAEPQLRVPSSVQLNGQLCVQSVELAGRLRKVWLYGNCWVDSYTAGWLLTGLM